MCVEEDVGELINEKVNDDCSSIWKNKICVKTRVQILVTFYHITLIFEQWKVS